jgi:dihydroorotase-like cyclic amidohydrolase
MKPPLRSCGHRDAIVDGLVAGTIGAIATDHAPHPGSEKMQEFERCPFGITRSRPVRSSTRSKERAHSPLGSR